MASLRVSNPHLSLLLLLLLFAPAPSFSRPILPSAIPATQQFAPEDFLAVSSLGGRVASMTLNLNPGALASLDSVESNMPFLNRGHHRHRNKDDVSVDDQQDATVHLHHTSTDSGAAAPTAKPPATVKTTPATVPAATANPAKKVPAAAPKVPAPKVQATPVAVPAPGKRKKAETPGAPGADPGQPPKAVEDPVPVLNMLNYPMQCDEGSGEQCKVLPDGTAQLSSVKDQHGVMHSPSHYLYGFFSVKMRLASGYSGGINFAFYLIDTTTGKNTDPDHAEIDVEFYGGSNPNRIFVATNVFAGGMQNLAQHWLPFDPSDGFHEYSFAWSNRTIIWFADGEPYRVVNRKEGGPWPTRAMKPMFSVWDTSGWTKLKADYSKGPVSGWYKDFVAQGCVAGPLSVESGCAATPPDDAAWNKPLDVKQLETLLDWKKKREIKTWGWDESK